MSYYSFRLRYFRLERHFCAEKLDHIIGDDEIMNGLDGIELQLNLNEDDA